MEVRVLRYFLTVVREESITRAAEVLHITQPTLSRQLSQLEDDIGVRLFVRGSRKISLTSEGILLRRRAEEILSLIDKTERELVEQDELIDGVISVGLGELGSAGLLPDIIGAFSSKYPLVSFDLFTANADLVKEHMDRGLIDIGLLLEPIDIERYDFIRLDKKERWVALMRPDDALAQLKSVTAEDLKVLPLILPRRLNIQNELASWFGDGFDSLNVLFTSNFTTNGAIMVRAGLAYYITLEGALPFWDSSKLTYRPISPELEATSVLAWKRHQPFSPAVTRFIEHIKCFLSMHHP